jgi:hypothetical protein
MRGTRDDCIALLEQKRQAQLQAQARLSIAASKHRQQSPYLDSKDISSFDRAFGAESGPQLPPNTLHSQNSR